MRDEEWVLGYYRKAYLILPTDIPIQMIKPAISDPNYSISDPFFAIIY